MNTTSADNRIAGKDRRSLPVLAAVLTLTAAWLAAGSTGLLAHPLRLALTWLAMGSAIVAVWPGWGGSRPGARAALLLLTVTIVAGTSSSLLQPVQVLGVAVVFCLLVIGQREPSRTILLITACAVTCFALYRFAVEAIAPLWIATDLLGKAIGQAGGTIARQPLLVGATFAGLDFLVLSFAALLASLALIRRGRTTRLLAGATLTLAAHAAYLVLLACSPTLIARLQTSETAELPFGQMVPWSWRGAMELAIPWNLPVLALFLHSMVMAIIMVMARNNVEPPPLRARTVLPERHIHPILVPVTVILAAALPVVTTMAWGSATLTGKKIVAYEKGFLNWLKPTHDEYGRLAIGMYGMLPQYVESLGGRCLISPELSEQDLADADVLILFYPDDPWENGQKKHIRDFVRRGGSLMVMGEHTVLREKKDTAIQNASAASPAGEPTNIYEDGLSYFNELLAYVLAPQEPQAEAMATSQPASIQIAFDSTEFAVGGWLDSYEPRFHPASAGVPDDRNQFGVVIGASVNARLPAQPLLIGRWGYNDPGDYHNSPSLMGNRKFDPGEKIGDIVLVAEQRAGNGKIVAFGDTSSMTNGITIGAHVYTSRLLAYLASDMDSPQALWRGLAGLVLAVALAGLLLWQPDVKTSFSAAAVLAVSLTFCDRVNRQACHILPDGRQNTPNSLAYIDASHLEASSSESWRNEGLMGLAQTLMRGGYLVLNLPEFTWERIERAGLIVSVGPARRFTSLELDALNRFMEKGGTFICTVGIEAPRREGGIKLLKEYGFYLSSAFPDSQGDTPEPEPMGHFKSRYIQDEEQPAYVRFHAAWPLVCTVFDENGQPQGRSIAYGRREANAILTRQIGKGRIIVVGDTCFAMNKNLENIGGEPFEGTRENADFWRWLFTLVNNQPLWLPNQREREREPEIPWHQTLPDSPLPAPSPSEPAIGTAPATQEDPP